MKNTGANYLDYMSFKVATKRLWLVLLGGLLSCTPLAAAELVMVGDFTGETKGIAIGVKRGLDVALAGRKDLSLSTQNHGFQPDKAVAAVNTVAAKAPLAFVANTDDTSIAQSLSDMVKTGIPMVGFISGLESLRKEPKALNLRASFHQEADYLLSQALANGFTPDDVCVYIENDEYGYGGLKAVRDALAKLGASAARLDALDRVLGVKDAKSERNNIGPVGTYKRNTLVSRDGYDSLKKWEEQSGQRCKLVMTVGVHSSVSKFIGYSRYKGEGWVVAALSITGMETLQESFKSFKIDEQVARRIVMTQVVPVLEDSLPVVVQAKAALGDDFTSLSLEGYLVGKMILALLGESAADGFDLVAAAKKSAQDLGGFTLDFTAGSQGSDYVAAVTLSGKGWQPMDKGLWAEWAK